MDREEAIKKLNALAWVQGGPDREEMIEAISMAIESLSATKPIVKNYDLISKEDAIKAVHKYFIDLFNDEPYETDEDGDEVFTDMKSVNTLLNHNKAVSKAIKALPSADRPSGTYICDGVKYIKIDDRQSGE